MLERPKGAADKKVRPDQAGLRKNKSCTDQIAALTVIIEQSMKWQSPFCPTLCLFRKKAFDNIDRSVSANCLKRKNLTEDQRDAWMREREEEHRHNHLALL